MKRSPLARKTRLKARREEPRRSSRVVDDDYLSRVSTMHCVAIRMMDMDELVRHPCYGPMHAHHMREASFAGAGQKPSDSFCVPFCQQHHDQWHSNSGIFKGLSKEWRKHFAAAAVEETRELLGWKEA